MQSTDEALANLAAALRPFQDLARDTLVTMSVLLVQTFLMVARKPDQTNSELARAAGVPNGTMSRLLSDLSGISRSGTPGLELVEQRIYILDRRHTTNRLSSKGAALVRQIAGALQGRRMSEAA
jgi:hypothetical protein